MRRKESWWEIRGRPRHRRDGQHIHLNVSHYRLVHASSYSLYPTTLMLLMIILLRSVLRQSVESPLISAHPPNYLFAIPIAIVASLFEGTRFESCSRPFSTIGDVMEGSTVHLAIFYTVWQLTDRSHPHQAFF